MVDVGCAFASYLAMNIMHTDRKTKVKGFFVHDKGIFWRENFLKVQWINVFHLYYRPILLDNICSLHFLENFI